jgi:D-alanyl-D-alanine carboxypeptidase
MRRQILVPVDASVLTKRIRAQVATTCIIFVATIVSAGSALANYASFLMDATSGRVLHETNADLTRYPASLTKMMTLYLLFEALDRGVVTLDEALPISEHAASRPPSKLGLKPGQSILVETAILALVTKSANDVAAAVAEHLGGSESRFAWSMTAKAHELGMSRTTFANASGLPDPDQVTTARDMAILGLALVHDFPHYYHYFSTDRFYYGGAVHANHNRLLTSYYGLDGIKTGYTSSSGFNLVASAVRDGRRLIGVVLGARSPVNRGVIMASLLDQAFDGGPIIEVQEEDSTPPVQIQVAAATPKWSETVAGQQKASALAARSAVRARVVRASTVSRRTPMKVARLARNSERASVKVVQGRRQPTTIKLAGVSKASKAQLRPDKPIAAKLAYRAQTVVAGGGKPVAAAVRRNSRLKVAGPGSKPAAARIVKASASGKSKLRLAEGGRKRSS